MKKMPAKEFQAHCLGVLARVQKTKEAIVITKNGRAIAKLIPADKTRRQFLGRLEGIVKITGDIESPIW
jgi:prevent-host-death family protein